MFRGQAGTQTNGDIESSLYPPIQAQGVVNVVVVT